MFAGLSSQAVAGSINGSYAYSYVSSALDGTCSAGSRDHFAGEGSNSIGGPNAITFSACNNTPGAIVGGLFSIIDDEFNSVSGFFSGVTTGTFLIGDITYGLNEGSYTISNSVGSYEGALDGTFTVKTGPVGTQLQGTGFLEIQSAPEPGTWMLAGAGLLAAIVGRRRVTR
ncbi:MAG: hypothetical protein JWN34_6186 [Bryobacterales bacterium]|jgi:hypothetical protein|nr:hypothetical protein [Bryobacterales bacterium]